MEAVILNGDQKSALSAVRSLSARGVNCTVGAPRKTGLALHSKYTKRSFVYASPLDEKEKFVQNIIDVCSSLPELPVLFAFSDATFLALSRERERVLKHARMLLPPKEQIEIAFDKARTMELAGQLEVPIPQTYIVLGERDIEAASSDISFPAIVKPRHSATWNGALGINGTVQFVHSAEELKSVVLRLKNQTGEFPIIEEYIQGEEYGVEVFVMDGKVLQWFAHKRIRSLSPTGGASVVKESIEVPSDLKEHSSKLMQALSWSGVAMIEFKRDSNKENKALLIEINGRFWGSLPLAVSAGIPFPHLYFMASLSGKGVEKIKEPFSYVSGLKTRYLLGDIKHLLMVLFKRDKMRNIAYPSRLKTLYGFVVSFWNTKEDVFRFSDPKPFFVEVVDRLL